MWNGHRWRCARGCRCGAAYARAALQRPCAAGAAEEESSLSLRGACLRSRKAQPRPLMLQDKDHMSATCCSKLKPCQAITTSLSRLWLDLAVYHIS